MVEAADLPRILTMGLIAGTLIWVGFLMQKHINHYHKEMEKHRKEADLRAEAVCDLTRQLLARDLHPVDREVLSDALHQFRINWGLRGYRAKPIAKLKIIDKLANANYSIMAKDSFRKGNPFWAPYIPEIGKDKSEPDV